jgi:hypothetical protein
MGAGDGEHPIKAGAARILFENKNGQPGAGTARLLDLRITSKVVVDASLLGLGAKVTSQTRAAFTPDHCGVVTTGKFDGRQLNWIHQARGYRANSDVVCDGAMCGKFGGPPQGKSKMSHGPHSVKLNALRFREGVRRFSMAYTKISHTESPRQTSYWQLEAVETQRHCVMKAAVPVGLRSPPSRSSAIKASEQNSR